MIQQTLETNFKRFRNFLGFARGFIKRKNPIKSFINGIVESIKDILTINKKLKLSKYRVHYHMRQLNKMESLIAENNDHIFLRGNKINEIR